MKRNPLDGTLYISSSKEDGRNVRTSSSVLVPKATDEEAIRDVLIGWRRRYPTEFEAHEKEVQLVRENLLKANGMTHGGNNMLVSMIPPRVYALIGKLMLLRGEPDWWHDEKNRRLFCQIYKNCDVRGPK